MGNITVPMIGAITGLIMTVAVAGSAITSSNSSNADGLTANAKVSRMGADLSASNITTYEGKVIKGSEVVAALQSMESEGITVRINNGTQIITYNPSDPNHNDISEVLGAVRERGSDTYVSDDQLYEGSILKDTATGAITELQFNTTGSGVRNVSNFNTDVNDELITSNSVYVDYYVNNGTNAMYYNDYIAEKGVADNIIAEYPTETFYQGHEFTGWSTNKNGGTTLYQPNQAITYNNDTQLYAIWKTKTYTIEFDANGGTGAPSNITKTWGINVTVPTTAPTMDNSEFLGWSKKQSGNTIYVKPGDVITADQDLKLYAVYKNESYKITYHAGNGGVGSDYTQPAVANGRVDLYYNQFTPDGDKIFIGWAASPTADSVLYTEGQSLYNVSGNMDLYALWQDIQKVTVTYNFNGGTHGPENETVEAGTYTVSDTTPTKDAMKFTGWLGSDGYTYSPGSTTHVIDDLTLTAQWSATSCTYTVRHVFMNLNGEYDVNDSSLVKTETRTTSTFTVTPNPIYREGFEEPDEDTIVPVKVSTDGSTVIEYRYPRINHEVSFVLDCIDPRKDSELKIPSVLEDSDAGKIVYSPVSDKYYWGSTIDADVDLNPGYEFVRWYTDYSNVRQNTKKTKFTVDEFTKEYTAEVQPRAYNITYVLNGGENAKNNPNTYLMPFSTRIDPASRTGYTFTGWSGSNTAQGWGINEDGSANPHSDTESMMNDYQFIIPSGFEHHLTFTANFTVNHYKVRFNPNGAPGSFYTSESYVYDKAEAIPDNRFTYANHKFEGWNTKADGTGLEITEIYKLSPDDGAIVDLYAIWTGEPAAEIEETSWVNDQTVTPNSTVAKNPCLKSVSSWSSYGLLRVAIPKAKATKEGEELAEVQDLVTLSELNTTDYIQLHEYEDDDYHVIYYGYNDVISGYGTTPELFTGITIPNFTSIEGSKQVSVDITAFICRKTDFTSVSDAYEKGMLG